MDDNVVLAATDRHLPCAQRDLLAELAHDMPVDCDLLIRDEPGCLRFRQRLPVADLDAIFDNVCDTRIPLLGWHEVDGSALSDHVVHGC